MFSFAKRSKVLLCAVTLMGLTLASDAAHAGLNLYTTDHEWVYLLGIQEASGVAYDWDRDELAVVCDEGGFEPFDPNLEEGLRPGRPYDLDGMYWYPFLGGKFDDSEGVTYIGNDQFVVAEERLNEGLITPEDFNMSSPTYVDPTQYSRVTFGTSGGNTGLEGVAYDPSDNSLWGVKENGPQLVYQMQDFRGANTLVNPFDGATLGLEDLSDIFVMANTPFFNGTPSADNLLILSQESAKIVEVTKTGTIVDTMDLSFLNDDKIEGLTVDYQGNLFLVSETDSSTMYKFAPIPEPASLLLLAFGAPLMLRRRSGNRA